MTGQGDLVRLGHAMGARAGAGPGEAAPDPVEYELVMRARDAVAPSLAGA